MGSTEQYKDQISKEKRLKARLALARTRLEEAEREHIWAIAAAHSEGLSMRKIVAAMGLSSSRVHQLLHTDEATQIPEWLTSLNEPKFSDDEPLVGDEQIHAPQNLQERLANEVEVLRWCITWLEQLARGERVVVSLRAESDPKTAYVSINQAWVLRVLKRVTADLDRLSGDLSPIEENHEREDPITAGVKHRYRLAEPEPELSSLSQREQRAILREKMGLPPL